MSNKTITFISNEDDVRPIAANVINLICARLVSNYQSNLQLVQQALSSGTNIEILAAIESFTEDMERSLKELDATSEIISHIEPIISDNIEE